MHDLRVEPLNQAHGRDGFDCGVPALNLYLQRQASQDMRRRIAQVFVAVDQGSPTRIIGYYGLSAASFGPAELAPDEARRLPRLPVPAALLGRLAVEQASRGKGAGEFLLLDALRRVFRASAALAVHAVIVDAKDDAATRFYTRYGFRAFPGNPRRLFLPLATIAKSGL